MKKLQSQKELNNLFSIYCSTVRKANNLTQKDLATALGVSQRTISQIEAAKKNVSAWEIYSICNYFEESADSNFLIDIFNLNSDTDFINHFSEPTYMQYLILGAINKSTLTRNQWIDILFEIIKNLP